jgi:hypothetical protein
MISRYGVNGEAVALTAAIVFSAVTPFFFFRWKGWL